MLRDARKKRWASTVALTILLLIVGVVTIAAMRTVYLPHATYGMRLAWGNNGYGERNLVVTRLAKAGAAYERAARLAGFAQASFERGVSRPVTEQGLFYELTHELRRELGNAAYDRE